MVIGIAALAVAFREELANFREYGYLGAFVVSLMAAATFIIYVPSVPGIFALCRAGKTVKGTVVCPLMVVGAELHSRYKASELLTLIGSRKIL